jgi:uncharacterized membrane protein YeaQ/YmgE (transglycosylase-associated protein family)
MSIESLLVLLVIAAICGAIGQAIVGYSLGGLLVTIGVGFVGAVLGVWLSGVLGLPEIFALRVGGRTFPVIWSILGSALFVAIVATMRSSRYRRAV